jgi:acyl-CoA thioester hydrolase
MSVVYHGNYMPYFEMGRVEWLRNKGISYKSLEENGIALPIVSMTINYKKPARYDDLLTVITKLKSQSSVKIEFDCEIRNENGDLLTTAYFLLVFVDINLGKPIAPPQYILDIMND